MNKHNPGAAGGGSQEEPVTRTSRRKLENLASSLQPHEYAIMEALQSRRYMTTGQIERNNFTDAVSPGAAQRTANRSLHRLKDLGLISPLLRRVGGTRTGSGSYIWGLTPSGYRLLNLDGGELPRKRRHEPSVRFVEHTLAVSELSIQLSGIDGVCVRDIQFEPACWRGYTAGGVKQQLQPDLYAVTTDGTYEDFWFFELDLATEAPSRVVSKCGQYQEYYRTGAEQRNHGLFPLVLWIVPDEKRRASIQEHIRQSPELTQKNLFSVILPDELEAVIRKGAGQ